MRAGRLPLIDRLLSHQLACGLAVAIAGLAVATIALLSTHGPPWAAAYQLHAPLPAGAPLIRPGTDVRIAGLYAGSVTAVRRTTGERQALTMRLSSGPVGANARATIRLRSAAGQFYVALDRGDYAEHPLHSGGTLAASNVRALEDLPTVVADFGKRALRDQSSTLRLLGGGLLGNGDDLNRGADGLDATVRRTTGLLRAATPGDALPRLIHQGSVTLEALGGRRPGDAGRLTTASADVFSALGDERSQLDAFLRRLPSAEQRLQAVLPRLDPLLTHTAQLATALRPTVRALHAALPSVRRLLASRRELAGAVPPLVGAAVPALRALAPVLRRVGSSAVLLSSLVPSLGQLADFMRRYPKDIETGVMSYYAAYLYHAPVGKAAGYPAAPSMLIFTCASGLDRDPKPGAWLTDHLQSPCR